MFAGGALIPVHLLGERGLIAREPARGWSSMCIVELERHDLVVAEGCAPRAIWIPAIANCLPATEVTEAAAAEAWREAPPPSARGAEELAQVGDEVGALAGALHEDAAGGRAGRGRGGRSRVSGEAVERAGEWRASTSSRAASARTVCGPSSR